MSKLEKAKGPVGRPKKSPSIPFSRYKGIITQGEVTNIDRNPIIEWNYTEISNFQKIMKTFKSCDVQFIYLYFLRNNIIIKGVTNPYNKTSKQSRLLKFSVDPSDTYSYYARTTQRFKIAISEWETPLQDMDESCNRFTIIYTSGNTFSIEVYNVSAVCKISTPITVEILDQDELAKYDEFISVAINTYLTKIINIKSINLKSLLGKSTRRNCQKSTFTAQNKMCQIDFELVTKHQIINFDVYTNDEAKKLMRDAANSKTGLKDKFYIINSSSEFCNVVFPNIEIYKFLLHLKSEIMEIYFTNTCAVVRALKPRVIPKDDSNDIHSSFMYYIPLDNM